MNTDLVLLNPGPAGTSERVRKALLRGDLCHREPEFSELLTRVRHDLARAAQVDRTHEAVLITGSGTAAMESAVISSVRAGRSALVVDNGVYGHRLASIAAAHGITTHVVSPPGDTLTRWTTPIDPAAVAEALRAHPDVDAVVCVHHETTTGLLNPVAEIGRIVAGTEAAFVVDAISALGNEPPGVPDLEADIVCGSANKGLHGLPGLAFLLLSDKGRDRIARVPARGLYLHAATHLTAQRRGEVAFTPAVQVLYALDEALQEFLDAGGHDARVALYRRRAELVRAGFTRLGLDILVAEPHRALSVTTLGLPDGVTYDRLHHELKDRGYVMYGGQGYLAERFFRICTLGEIPWHKLEELEPALRAAITAART